MRNNLKYLSLLATIVVVLDSIAADVVSGRACINNEQIRSLTAIMAEPLERQLAHNRAEWGCAVLMDAHSREVLAVYNSDSISHEGQWMELGSVLMPVSYLACMSCPNFEDKGIQVSKDAAIFDQTDCQGQHYTQYVYDGHPRDTILYGRDMIATSSNIAITTMVREYFGANPEAFLEKLEGFGLKSTVPADSTEDTGLLTLYARGYKIAITPLLLTDLYSRFATGKDIVASPQSLTAIRESLHDVVWRDDWGTASRNIWGLLKAQSDIVRIAGKAGTIQLMMDGKYSERDHTMSFVGYFPEDDPKYTCLVIIHHPGNVGLYDAGNDCGKTVRLIAEKIMSNE